MTFSLKTLSKFRKKIAKKFRIKIFDWGYALNYCILFEIVPRKPLVTFVASNLV